jgi:hypothetical protein
LYKAESGLATAIDSRAVRPEHIGFERDLAAGFAKTRDVNGIEWEQFSPKERDRRIGETYGNAIRQTSG